ncbi:MAG: translation initiation factor IF-2, partial [Candidatus Omnitrophota bacterium]|nr:translation initiation factor IF-2 [Candidatus Omnitrophota bacterium]
IAAKSHMSSIDQDSVVLFEKQIEKEKKPAVKKEKKPAVKKKIKPALKKTIKPAAKEGIKPALKKEAEPVIMEEKVILEKIQLKVPVRVTGLAIKLGVKPNEILKRLLKLNIIVNVNSSLDENIVRIIVKEFNYQAEILPTEEEAVFIEETEDKSKLVKRPPVVTLMGHVDHGKTSLLDAIRQTNLTTKEAGKITQHIGAYEVILDRGQVTFLDTPGHEAFTAMRARGANVTDIVVLVVAADDGVMTQTIEAIDHARAADVPIVVAINKIDLPGANLLKIKRQLQSHGLTAEDMGGETITVGVSARTEEGIDELLEMLLLEAEMLELKENPDKSARGVIVEGKLSAGRGSVATVLVKSGTLRTGDIVITGRYYGKIKSMVNDRGQMVSEAPPSIPVEISGLSGVPVAGDKFFVVKNEKLAKEISSKRKLKLREKELESISRITLEDIYKQIKEGKIKELNIILKADVRGSVEALKESLEKLSTAEIRLKVIHVGVGKVNESDVMLAAASKAIIIGFHIKRDSAQDELFEKEGVDARFYDVIYEAIADVRAAMEGLLEPGIKKIVLGRSEVRQVFKVSKIGTIAGCSVKKGKMVRNSRAQLVRAGAVIYDGTINSLKRFKEDAKEVEEGFECGIGFDNFKDIKAKDIIESYKLEKIARRL